jgi:hypothetical protein
LFEIYLVIKQIITIQDTRKLSVHHHLHQRQYLTLLTRSRAQQLAAPLLESPRSQVQTKQIEIGGIVRSRRVPKTVRFVPVLLARLVGWVHICLKIRTVQEPCLIDGCFCRPTWCSSITVSVRQFQTYK